MRKTVVLLAAAVAALASCGAVAASGTARVAALQVGLHENGWYTGDIDGIAGPATLSAVRAVESSRGLSAALGPFAPRSLGSRVLVQGMVGADVAALQFELAWHGFPSGVFDGRFGEHLRGAVARFQRFSGLPSDGAAGPATLQALRTPLRAAAPRLAWPVRVPVGDRFGVRGDRFHAGIDLVAPMRARVGAAAAGRVVWSGTRSGWGLCVVVAHGGGIRTLYAHLLRADVRLGQRVITGTTLGVVGATGDATGPHLHFEVRVRGAAIDPLSALA
jgi:peptidoglycan hydrolase-like protein with peptidoglycan-binding domain